MKLRIKSFVKEEFLPTSRHKKLRKRYVEKEFTATVKEVNEAAFPLTFIVSDYGSRFLKEGEEAVFGIYDTEIRAFGSKLYKPVLYSERVTNGVGYYPVEKVAYEITRNIRQPFNKGQVEEFCEESQVISSNERDVEDSINRLAANIIIFDNKIWQSCGEPVYSSFYDYGILSTHLRVEYVDPKEKYLRRNESNALEKPENMNKINIQCFNPELVRLIRPREIPKVYKDFCQFLKESECEGVDFTDDIYHEILCDSDDMAVSFSETLQFAGCKTRIESFSDDDRDWYKITVI